MKALPEEKVPRLPDSDVARCRELQLVYQKPVQDMAADSCHHLADELSRLAFRVRESFFLKKRSNL